MAIYAIGDVQGCDRELQQLLEKIAFQPQTDELWFVGDLVNRGSDSLAVLRRVKALGNAAVVVLGNHDLHLLAVAAGVGKPHPSDTLDDILHAPDREELLDWLRQRPLLHHAHGYTLVHAGLLPNWTISQAAQLAREVETQLRGTNVTAFFENMYGNQPSTWHDNLCGHKRTRVIINAFTRMRVCSPQGEMEFKFKGELPDVPAGYLPWFAVPQRANRHETIIFGHWSALGLYLQSNVIALDSGCLWGGQLTAIRLADRQLFQVACTKPLSTKIVSKASTVIGLPNK